ncbi:MAG: histidine kinase, partial [Mycobacterium sp.]
MTRKLSIDLRLATQVLILQLVVVALTLVIAFAMFAVFSRHRITYEYGIRALDVARVLAAVPAVRSDVTRYDQVMLAPGPALTDELASGPLQTIASEVRQRTGVLFVVITNNHGIRLAHPDRAALGEHVSTDPTEALAGHEDVLEQSGTLGPSVRAKVPILEPNSNQVVGEVSVGISTAAVQQQLFSNIRTSAVFGVIALLVGVAGSVLLSRRWRGLTLGLRPTEMAELVRGQAAVLHGIGEGVLAADMSWNTTFVNDEACRLLRIDNAPGRPVDQIGLTERVLGVFKAAESAPTLATVGERIVVVSARPVSREGRDLGTVLV